MMAATHRLGGIAAGTALAVALKADVGETGILLAGAVLGSLLPDIDNRNSTISYKIPLVSLLVTAGQAVIRGISCLFPRKQKNYIRSLIGHRGLTHSLLAAVLLPLLVSAACMAAGFSRIGLYVAVGLLGGMLSHLCFDMLAGGAPLFMPLTTKRVVLAKIKTGGLVEWLFRLLLVAIFVYFGMEVIPWERLLHV